MTPEDWISTYPDVQDSTQKREYDDTFSAATVLKEEFFSGDGGSAE